ncbi:transcriptional regulator [Sinirhodobacter populi]|uniref:Transcriptional regulator n=2 Tax=Paenirhodobacter populi TaxID=2306993 RepID=A0A443J6I8_9RHOB|nr:transcriptional regulator [Sinirhodobacter populi]
MASGNTVAEVAHLIGDAARANMLAALMGGQALTAGELARHAGVTPQTTSGHLIKLTEARLLAVERQGRHRYYRLASPEVAQAIHALSVLAVAGPKRHHPIGPKDAALRLARTCYDHIAGRLALALADSLVREGHVILSDGAGLVTDCGRRFLTDFGINTEALHARRPLCRTCLDWSERRPHIAGQLGAALLGNALEQGWLMRTPESRALRITRSGEIGFATTFRLPLNWREQPGR